MSNRVMVSVIMPCYNVEDYVEEAIGSVCKQTLQDFELICLDDGSTDNTLSILKELQQEHDFIRVVENENKRQGYERNEGIKLAQGKYIHFLDADDIIAEDCLERSVACMEENQLDLLLFEGNCFYETVDGKEKFPQFKHLYDRKHIYPDIYVGKDLYVQLRQNRDFIVQPGMQMARREFLIEKEIHFSLLPMLEDNLYSTTVLLAAEKVQCIGDKFYSRRIHDNSTMTTNNEQYVKDRVYCFTYIINEMMGMLEQYKGDAEVYQTLIGHITGIVRQMQNALDGYGTFDFSTLKENFEHLNAETIFPIFLHYDNRADIKKANAELNAKLQNAYVEKSELNAKLQRTYEEKSELNAKLQKTYEEKSELNAKLQKTYEEKSELNAKLQKTYEEKSELNAKLQQTYAEKSERGLQIKELKEKNKELTTELSASKQKSKIRIHKLKEKLTTTEEELRSIQEELNAYKETYFYKIYKKLQGLRK